MGEAPGKDRKRIWYGLLSAALAAVLLYYSLRGVEWARVWTTIIHARGQFLAVAGLTLCCSFFLRSYRWRILLNTDADFDVLTVFIATMAGYLGNAFLPARAGEFAAFPIMGYSLTSDKIPQTTLWEMATRSEEHTSELQSLRHLVCRLLLEK